jgi:flagella basal body P-ring formation protein FlgA
VISSTDVALERRTFTSFQGIGVTASNRVVGQEARRIIHTGQMIKASDLKPKVLVKRNELVRISSTGGGVVLHTAARALQSGALGDVIEVRNEASKQTFWAQVTGLRQAQAVGDHDERVESEQLARGAA